MLKIDTDTEIVIFMDTDLKWKSGTELYQAASVFFFTLAEKYRYNSGSCEK